jgi:hypothetical protein
MGKFSMSIAALGAGALILVGDGAYALASATGGTITVCVKRNNGSLYKSHKCAKQDKKLTWNVTGPAGPPGPSTGPAGGALSGSLPNPTLASAVISDTNVKPGSLTGASVNASTLGKVPSAGTADTATTASAPGTLPSGKTEKGAFGVEVQAPTAGSSWSTTYSFAFPLAGTVAATYLGPGVPPTTDWPRQCLQAAGDTRAPVPVANKALNVGTVVPADPTMNLGGFASPYGFFIEITTTAAGDAFTTGSWAVTAS